MSVGGITRRWFLALGALALLAVVQGCGDSVRRVGHIAWSCRPLAVMPIHRTKPRKSLASLASMNRIHWNACGPLPAAAFASEVPQCPSPT